MPDTVWWKRGVIYQVYPRSFQSDGDGVGDLNGIRARLDYLEWLGVDAIWISPIYPSPMADFGYDVADYRGIHELFGTLADFDRLAADIHGRGMKLILDFVPNHSSDRHPWFEESRSSRENGKRDWYIWRDPAPDGGPPNNWVSHFGGSAWQFDEATGQDHYHAFLKEQPDLNWRNPAVRKAMYDALRFWLKRGVDGFRVDVMWHLMKDSALRNEPPNPAWREGEPDIDRLIHLHSADQPEVHEVVREMRAVLDEFSDRVLIGEIYLPIHRLMAYYGKDLREAQLPFNFQLIHAAWNAENIGHIITDYEAALPAGGWPNWVLGNHDKSRIGSRVGAHQARVAAMLLLTLRGTPTMYFGDEIGMMDVPIPPEAVRDPWAINEPGIGVGRDPERTPMQWDASANAGFTTGQPWLPLADDFAGVNVAAERENPASMLSLVRALIGLRRAHPALRIGDLKLLSRADSLLAYERSHGGETLRILLNMGTAGKPVAADLLDGADEILVSTDPAREPGTKPGKLVLAPDEGIVMRCHA